MPTYLSNQAGRSMVEILGVLAIIGVLSVGGIAGYSKAMQKININKLLTETHLLIQKSHTLFASKKDGYGDVDNKLAINIGMIPDTMKYDNKWQIRGVTGGELTIKSVDREKTLVIVYNGLEREECVLLATQDWSAGASGLKYFIVSPTGVVPPRGSPNNLDVGEFTGDQLPLSLDKVVELCNCNPLFKCGITWFYQ